jgi:hypothetical protein
MLTIGETRFGDLMRSAEDLGCGRRDPEFGCGKRMGDRTWIHRSAAWRLATHPRWANIFEFGEDWNVVRIDRKTGAPTFFLSPDFDAASEPATGNAVTIDIERRRSDWKSPADPWIWHHKWQWVDDDYEGFDVAKSILWSIRWKAMVGISRHTSSRIGRRSVWVETLRSLDLIAPCVDAN